jgi:hypothetical protein
MKTGEFPALIKLAGDYNVMPIFLDVQPGL